MSKIKNWIVDEKKHVRFYHDWNDKEVFKFKHLAFCTFSVEIVPVFIGDVTTGFEELVCCFSYYAWYYSNKKSIGGQNF